MLLQFDRRRFLKNSVGLSFATAVVTLGGACSQPVPPPPAGLKVLNAQQAQTLRAVAATVLAGASQVTPARIEALIGDIDGALASEHSVLQAKIRDALLFLEWSPQFSLQFKPFSTLDAAGRRHVLERFANSPLKLTRAVCQVLTTMVLFAYADRPDVWPAIGYDGPLVMVEPSQATRP